MGSLSSFIPTCTCNNVQPEDEGNNLENLENDIDDLKKDYIYLKERINRMEIEMKSNNNLIIQKFDNLETKIENKIDIMDGKMTNKFDLLLMTINNKK
jgi:uncharacterized transporter YbjL